MFAGPNGAGKTVLKSYLSSKPLGVYLNPDEIQNFIETTGTGAEHLQSRCDDIQVRLEYGAVNTDTLAQKLGTTVHFSPLLRKIRRLGLSTPKDLWTLAVQRGCRHYWQGDEPEGELVSQNLLTNEELAIALLNSAGNYNPHSIRCGAAMLGAIGNNPATVATLAIWERSVAVVRFVAECGRKFEPLNPYWSDVLSRLPACKPPKDGVMPHPTRFVAMSGYERGVGKKITTEWQRPQRRAA